MSWDYPNFLRNRCAKLNLHPGPRKDVYPKSLRVAQAIVFALDFCKFDFAFLLRGFFYLFTFFRCNSPEKQVWDAATSLPIFLSHDFTNCGQRLAVEAASDLDKIGYIISPI